ncbi:kunitz-type serine protease inhibitor bungaruskunin-like [Pecten maximus]|uniref:kunitz-type serine protease inhibitor bungaruskunin-like n=1 Tax=Pecten maximus TaxID=6579 RepID=UPI001458C273|nr:kunitz-type serine protease inhibitor bungaruskunin-like [Pecten maximus]XP_033762679.1 kunitz-type serine protease inhibitor bungaruskunin-like [Pecten maximus]
MRTALIVAIMVLVIVDLSAAKRPAHCKLDVDHGHHCQHSARERVYFDMKTKSCKSFNYRGCGGNKNRFKSHHDCHKECA